MWSQKTYSDVDTLEKVTYSHKNDLFRTWSKTSMKHLGIGEHLRMDAGFGQGALEALVFLLFKYAFSWFPEHL